MNYTLGKALRQCIVSSSPCQKSPCPALFSFIFHNYHTYWQTFLTLPNVPLPSTFRNSKFSNVCQLRIGLAMVNQYSRTFIINNHCAIRQIYVLCQKKEQYYIFSFYSDCARHTIITINYLMQHAEKSGQILFMVFVWAFMYASFVDTGKSLVILQFLINIFESTNLVRGSSDWFRVYGVIQLI